MADHSSGFTGGVARRSTLPLEQSDCEPLVCEVGRRRESEYSRSDNNNVGRRHDFCLFIVLITQR